jgi:hypothetical protein
MEWLVAGLPDGLFCYQKSQFGYILEGLGMENVIFENIWTILTQFVVIYGRLVEFVVL